MRAHLKVNPVPWDVRIEIRPGVVVRTLSPHTAQNAPAIAAKAVIDRWPGVLAWLRRAIVGDKAVVSGTLRAMFRAVTEWSDHHLAGELDDGELMQFVKYYQQAETHWCLHAEADASRQLREKAPVPVHAPPPARAERPAAAPRSRTPRPGDRLVMPGGASVVVPYSESRMVEKFGGVMAPPGASEPDKKPEVPG